MATELGPNHGVMRQTLIEVSIDTFDKEKSRLQGIFYERNMSHYWSELTSFHDLTPTTGSAKCEGGRQS